MKKCCYQVMKMSKGFPALRHQMDQDLLMDWKMGEEQRWSHLRFLYRWGRNWTVGSYQN
ncbi:MAG TPA: hypothetical protein IAA58_05625 [Candidatus Gallacutalibacter stercoravium]|nr:hypothetical protein [Candidatus Gallacutalibacter stercoravium]